MSKVYMVKSWSEFQHYKDRKPPWIKLHRSLLDSWEYASLSPMSAKLLPLVWLLASEEEGCIDVDVHNIAFRFRMTEKEVKPAVDELVDKM